MSVVLGMDLGTSAVKVLAVREDGDLLASASAGYPLHQPRAGWSEQDPADWWQGAKQAIQKIIGDPAVKREQITALALSGQMHGSVFLDDKHEVIRPPLLWNDTRTYKQCEYINDTIGEENLLQLVGNPALEGFTLPKLIWARENVPACAMSLSTHCRRICRIRACPSTCRF